MVLSSNFSIALKNFVRKAFKGWGCSSMDRVFAQYTGSPGSHLQHLALHTLGDRHTTVILSLVGQKDQKFKVILIYEEFKARVRYMRPHLKNKMKLNKIKASGTHIYNKGTLTATSTILVELTKFMSLHLCLQNTALLYTGTREHITLQCLGVYLTNSRLLQNMYFIKIGFYCCFFFYKVLESALQTRQVLVMAMVLSVLVSDGITGMHHHTQLQNMDLGSCMSGSLAL